MASTSMMIRGISTPSDLDVDRITIKGIKLFGRHGYSVEENKMGLTFVVDATISCSLEEAGKTDYLTKTINYASLYTIIEKVVTGPARKLIETVAEEICNDILEQHPRASKVQIHVQKQCIPGLPSVVDTVGVEITRTRNR